MYGVGRVFLVVVVKDTQKKQRTVYSSISTQLVLDHLHNNALKCWRTLTKDVVLLKSLFL